MERQVEMSEELRDINGLAEELMFYDETLWYVDAVEEARRQ